MPPSPPAPWWEQQAYAMYALRLAAYDAAAAAGDTTALSVLDTWVSTVDPCGGGSCTMCTWSTITTCGTSGVCSSAYIECDSMASIISLNLGALRGSGGREG